MFSQDVIESQSRRRSYVFCVTLEKLGARTIMYDGVSCRSATAAYWNAIFTLGFFGCTGTIRVAITDKQLGSGGFYTRLQYGSAADLHVGYGLCAGWRSRAWGVRSITEKFISRVPGTEEATGEMPA